MRNLVICLDGTNEQIGKIETNVLKIYRALDRNESQHTLYIMGVGTDDSASAVRGPWQKLVGVLGLAFGLGLEDDVLQAYRWLCRHYRNEAAAEAEWRRRHPRAKPPAEFEADRIYVIGFSRGAYAARVLAGFIHDFGLIEEDALHLATPAFRAYRRIADRDRDAPDNVRFRTLRQFEKVLRPTHPPIRALCLFDTVASVIRMDWPWYTIPRFWSLANLGLHRSTHSNPSVRIVIQALAVNERRTFFRAMHWIRTPYFGNRFNNPVAERSQHVRQRWFAGFHGDIGGSVPEDEAGIGKITANWMIDALAEAERAADAEDDAHRAERGKPPLPRAKDRPDGLQFRRGNREVYLLGGTHGNISVVNPAGHRYSPPDPFAPLHNSVFSRGWIPQLSWLWLVLELIPPKAALRREKGPVALIRRLWPYYFPLLEPRHIPDDHEIDDSVFLRRQTMRYDPANLRRVPERDPDPWWERAGAG